MNRHITDWDGDYRISRSAPVLENIQEIEKHCQPCDSSCISRAVGELRRGNLRLHVVNNLLVILNRSEYCITGIFTMSDMEELQDIYLEALTLQKENNKERLTNGSSVFSFVDSIASAISEFGI